jgi:hypothetical protein
VFTHRLYKDFTHINPLESVAVASPSHYLYSAAIDYEGGKGLLDVPLLVTKSNKNHHAEHGGNGAFLTALTIH